MAVTFLIYNEDPDFASVRVDPVLFDQLCTMYGYSWAYIDLLGNLRSGANVFASLAAAQFDAQFAGHSWVYFSSEGSQYIDEFDHPADNAVYVAGPADGYQRPLLPGTTLKVRTAAPERNDWHGAPVLMAALFDRWLGG